MSLTKISDEDEAKLKELTLQVEEIIRKYPLKIHWITILRKDDLSVFLGNWCPVCALGKLTEWIAENNITHVELNTEGEKVH